MKKWLAVCLIVLVVSKIYGQNAFLGKSETELSSSAVYTNKEDQPFWFRVNKNGENPQKGSFLQLKINHLNDYDSLFTPNKQLNKFSIGYGLTGLANISKSNTHFILSQAYLKLRFNKLELYAGRRKEIFGLVDSLNTSGSYIWSGNALPMPKVQIHTPGYVSLGKKKFLSFNAGISHGWFGKDSVVQGHWLHQKWLYGRIGKPKGKFHFTAGINHQVMWGGYSEILKDGSRYTKTINGYLAPYPFYSYKYVILPFLQKIVPPDPSKVPGYDGGLAIGNQLGSVDLSFSLKTERVNWLFYKQTPYDFARSLYHLNNIEDGLYGLNARLNKSKYINSITLEYFYSLSQGRYRFGKLQESNSGEYDNYFSHGQYQSWSYKENILGSPFILNEDNPHNQFNNRVKYFYIHVSGALSNCLSYEIKSNGSVNYGTYSRPLLFTQYNNLLSLNYRSNKNNSFLLNLAYDNGKLYNSSFGLTLGYYYLFN